MRRWRVHLLAACGAATFIAASQTPAMPITSPAAAVIINVRTTIEVTITPAADVKTVTFFVDGKLVCGVDRPPLTCVWDPGPVLRGHHVRVVAVLADGRRLVDNLHTKDLGYAERVRTDAVL